ncbi:Nonsense-mediated mRNA decay protein 5, partial [Spiromyces aspiralis]
MDTMELASLFEATYHHDVQVRKQAEQRLGQLEGNPHLLTAIMHLLKANNVPLATQQAAAIYFKNRVRRYWDISSDRENNANIEQQISNEDQAFLKREILSLLVHAPNAIQVQLTSSLNCVLATDFPEKWPEFIHQVVQLIQSANSQAVYTGLISLLEVIKVYRFRSLKRRGPLTEIVEVVFPQLQKVAEAHLESTDPLAIPIIKTIFKSYALAIQAELPTSLQNNESLVGWGTLFIKLVERPIPLDESLDEDEQAQLSVWKSKKWAYHCINKLFSRYGNPSLLPTKQNQYQAFAKTFILHFIPQIFQAYIGQTTLYVSKQAWMSPKIRYFTAAFFSD